MRPLEEGEERRRCRNWCQREEEEEEMRRKYIEEPRIQSTVAKKSDTRQGQKVVSSLLLHIYFLAKCWLVGIFLDLWNWH